MSLDPGLAAQRFGYGLRPGRAEALGASLGSAADPALVLHPGPDSTAARILRNGMEDRLSHARALSRAALRETRKQIQDEIATLNRDSLKRALARAVDSPDGYRERLVWFWADHFTIITRDGKDQPRLLPYADEVIRPHLTGRFAPLLRAAILHPLMLVYLDQTRSVGPGSRFGLRRGRGLNENLARELLELHSLGVDAGYGQDDVRQLAKLLTGLVLSPEGLVAFEPDRAEPGAETVLGKTYGGRRPGLADVEAVLEDLARHPATARHLAAKLAAHFVTDRPPAPLVADLADLWQASDGDLGQVQRALIAHPLAQGPELGKARQPFEFLVAALRALGVDGTEILGWSAREVKFIAEEPLRQMAQPWQTPAGPDGWEEALEHWITPQALARRIGWAMRVPARLRPELPDARAFLTATLPGAEPAIAPLIARAETNSEGIGLVLAAPQFNRR